MLQRIACGAKNTGIGNGMVEYGRAVLRPEADGTVTLFHSWTEMGQGVHTVLRQIACEALGLPPERIRVLVDTDHELETGQTTASRATVLGGGAVLAGLVLGALAALIIDHKLKEAGFWALAGAVLAFFGFIHGTQLGWAVSPQVALGYLLFAAVCFAASGSRQIAQT